MVSASSLLHVIRIAAICLIAQVIIIVLFQQPHALTILCRCLSHDMRSLIFGLHSYFYLLYNFLLHVFNVGYLENYGGV